MQQVDLSTIDIKELACPKCGVIGSLTLFGWDYRKKYRRVWCTSCERVTSERKLGQSVGATAKPAPPGNNNNLNKRIDELEDMIRQLLAGGNVATKPKAEPTTFNWDDYSEEQGVKIQQLISILREHPKWGSYKLQKELQRLKMGLRMTDIIKVKNAFGKGVFDG